jgi:hypothetical protein
MCSRQGNENHIARTSQIHASKSHMAIIIRILTGLMRQAVEFRTPLVLRRQGATARNVVSGNWEVTLSMLLFQAARKTCLKKQAQSQVWSKFFILSTSMMAKQFHPYSLSRILHHARYSSSFATVSMSLAICSCHSVVVNVSSSETEPFGGTVASSHVKSPSASFSCLNSSKKTANLSDNNTPPKTFSGPSELEYELLHPRPHNPNDTHHPHPKGAPPPSF